MGNSQITFDNIFSGSPRLMISTGVWETFHEEKLDQNEELAKMRADTSIEKTVLGKTLNPRVEKKQ